MNKEFNFNNNISPYTEILGSICPDTYCYAPKIGDTIELSYKFLGLTIKRGEVFYINEMPKDVLDIVAKLDEYEEINSEDKVILNKYYDFYRKDDDNYLSSDVQDCLVKFEKELDKNKFQNLSIQLKKIQTTENKIKAQITKNENGKFILSGFLRCFIDGLSVLSTKKIDDFKASHAKNQEIENVAWSDNVLSIQDLNDLNLVLDRMCLNEKKDYHPGSNKIVRDLVHPSLYCYVKGLSKVEDSDITDYKIINENNLQKNNTDFWGREYEDSIYQWLPAEFFVSNNGTVSVNSYINNLNENKYKEGYNILSSIFADIFPMFEKVCSSLKNDFYGVDMKEKGKSHISLKNRKLQVVTKIVEYKVNETANFDGVWHVEGMSHENVLATGLCIIKRDANFDGAEIEFRRFLFENEAEDLIYSTPQNANRPTDTMGGVMLDR
jgi:hypothetical protein